MSPAPIRPETSGVPLDDLARRLSTATHSGSGAGVLVTGMTLDSRAVQPGDLYAALPGFNVHGARYAGEAVAAGAVAVLTDPQGVALLEAGEPVGVPVVCIDRPREVLGDLAAHVYGHPAADLTVLGVTGTNGKTTTAYLLESALRAHGLRTGLIGTIETRIGDDRVESERTTPEATDLHALLGVMRERGIDACVMEVSSHALELHRVDGLVYDVAMFTNLSQDHLDFHPTMEAYYAAKASLFTPARARAAVVAVDDEWGARLARETREARVAVTTLSTRGDIAADWVVEPTPGDAEVGSDAPARFVLRETSGTRRMGLTSHLPGAFNVANAALAAVGLLAAGLSSDEVESALAVTPDVPGRMEVVDPGGDHGPRVVVDFAHSPDAIDAALQALRPTTDGRLIAVLGAGGDRDRGKRGGMGAAAARRADVVVVTDDNPRSEDPDTIRAAVMAGALDAVATGTATATEVVDGGARASAITGAVALAVGGRAAGKTDTVVVLGKGHEKGQEIGGVKHPFDDRDAVRAALSALSAGSVPQARQHADGRVTS